MLLHKQILSADKLILLRQASEDRELNGLLGNHVSDEFANYTPPLSGQSRRCGRFNSIHIIFSFHVLGACTVSCSQQGLCRLPRFSAVFKYIRPFFSVLNNLIHSLGSTLSAAENSNDRSLYDDVNAWCRPSFFATLPSSINLVTATWGARDRTKFGTLAVNSRNVANNRGIRPLRKLNLSGYGFSSQMLWGYELEIILLRNFNT